MKFNNILLFCAIVVVYVLYVLYGDNNNTLILHNNTLILHYQMRAWGNYDYKLIINGTDYKLLNLSNDGNTVTNKTAGKLTNIQKCATDYLINNFDKIEMNKGKINLNYFDGSHTYIIFDDKSIDLGNNDRGVFPSDIEHNLSILVTLLHSIKN